MAAMALKFEYYTPNTGIDLRIRPHQSPDIDITMVRSGESTSAEWQWKRKLNRGSNWIVMPEK